MIRSIATNLHRKILCGSGRKPSLVQSRAVHLAPKTGLDWRTQLLENEKLYRDVKLAGKIKPGNWVAISGEVLAEDPDSLVVERRARELGAPPTVMIHRVNSEETVQVIRSTREVVYEPLAAVPKLATWRDAPDDMPSAQYERVPASKKLPEAGFTAGGRPFVWLKVFLPDKLDECIHVPFLVNPGSPHTHGSLASLRALKALARSPESLLSGHSPSLRGLGGVPKRLESVRVMVSGPGLDLKSTSLLEPLEADSDTPNILGMDVISQAALVIAKQQGDTVVTLKD